jgi:hypothetical protein
MHLLDQVAVKTLVDVLLIGMDTVDHESFVPWIKIAHSHTL